MGIARLLAVAVVIALIASPLAAAPPSDEEIAKAIKDLSDRRFAVREKATKFLWAAGKKAEPALLQTLKNDDPETVRRAKQILERFTWGIYPDTPKAIVDLIAQYRDGTEQTRSEVIAKLIPLGRHGVQSVRVFIDRAQNDQERRKLRTTLTVNAQRGVPPLILSGDNQLAEELLEICIDEEEYAGATNYAAFHALTGTLDAAIARWDKLFAGRKERSRPGITLAHLYRAKGDFAKAHEVAKALDNRRLIEDVFWEEGNWKELARFHAESAVSNRGGRALGARAAYHRLAGDSAGYEKMIEELSKAADTTEPYQFFAAVEGLLLNHRTSEGIQLLIDRKIRIPVAFELLAAQLKVREALQLASEAKALTAPEQFELDLARARLLHRLGEQDQALQLFNQLGNRFQQPEQMSDVRRLVKTMSALQLEEPALEIAARFLALCEKQQHSDYAAEILEPFFGDDESVAEAWWRFIRSKNPSEESSSVIKKVRSLMQGKPLAERDAWIKELTSTAAAPSKKNRDPAGNQLPATEQANVASAVALMAAGDERGAETYLKIAAEESFAVKIRYADFLAERKRWTEAVSWYEKAAQQNPADPLPRFLFGWSMQQDGQKESGKKAIDQSHILPLGSEQARAEFANQLAKRGFDDDARRECDLVRKLGWYRDWHVGNVLTRVAASAIRDRDFQLAADCFQKGVIGYLRNELVYFVISEAYVRVPQSVVHCRAIARLNAGKHDEALKLLNLARDAMPGDIELVIRAYPELRKAGRKSEAQKLFDSVYQRHVQLCADFPKSAFAHNSLAWLAANCNRNLDEAVQHGQKAVKLEPKNAGYLDTLAEAHFRRGEKDKAVELMKQCVAMEPKRPYFRKQLERFQKGDVHSPVPAEDDEE